MVSPLSLTGLVYKNLLRRRLRILLTVCASGIAIEGFIGLIGFSNSLQHARPRSCTSIAVIQQTFLNSSRNESARRNLTTPPEVRRATPMIYNGIALPEINAPILAWKAGYHEFQSLELMAISGWTPGGKIGRSILREPEQEAGSYSGGDAA